MSCVQLSSILKSNRNKIIKPLQWALHTNDIKSYEVNKNIKQQNPNKQYVNYDINFTTYVDDINIFLDSIK